MAIERHERGWRVNVHTGKAAANLPEPFTGKARLTKLVRTSRKDAERVEREYKDLVETARHSDRGVTANQFLPDFLDAVRSGSTRSTYDFALRTFIHEHGDKPLVDWNEQDARKTAASLPKGNVIVVKTFFTRAAEKGHIPTNPFREIAPSTGRQIRTKEEFHKLWPLDPKEQRELFSQIVKTAGEECGPDAKALVAWQGWTGTRPGEAFVLRRERLDLRNDEAEIAANFDRSTSAESRGTKNRLSRHIVVPPDRELREALANQPAHLHQPYVFTNNGKPWKPATWQNRWDIIRRKAGIRDMRFYDLRHFCATQLLEMGVSYEDVAVQLGHEDGGILVRTVYGHPSRDAARERIRHTLRTFGEATRHNVRHIDEAREA